MPVCLIGRCAASLALAVSVCCSTAPAAESDDAFLDDLQRRTFEFFWTRTPADSGLTPDRWPSESPCSILSVGFALAAYPIGAERGWVTREEAAQRTVSTLRFFWRLPQNTDPHAAAGWRGFYYHFLDMGSGRRYRDCELSSADTSLLMMGVLFAGSYFDHDTPVEREIRDLSDALYRRVEWNWMQPRPPLVAMAWYPETGDHGPDDYQGYDEVMHLYLLAIGSPTHPVDPAAWDAFTKTYEWGEFYGHEHVNFEPLFGHQHSHTWVDFRGVADRYLREKGIDYFENSRRATLAQREYAIANPGRWRGYGADQWGLTACDGPVNGELEIDGQRRRFHTYMARGAAATRVVDDGTITPTAAGGSIPFAPAETIAALRHMRQEHGDRLYGEHGFRDAFNPTFRDADARVVRGVVDPEHGWYDCDYLGHDQGPILLMIENHRSQLVWRVMRKNPYLLEGMRRAGLKGGWLDEQVASP